MYFTKKDALGKLKKSSDIQQRLIQIDYKKNGAKAFDIMNQNELFKKIKENQSKNKHSHYYESWTNDTQMVFALDIDASDKLNNEEFDEVIKKNIKVVIKNAKTFYKFTYKINNIIILKTKKQSNKQSAHIIFRGLGFENYLVCKNFFNRMKKNLIDCDASIYNLTCLRTCFSTKKGKDFPLLPYKLSINNKETATIQDYETELDYFVQTLITTIDTEELNNEIIYVDQIEKETDIEYKSSKELNNVNNPELKSILEHLPDEYCNEYIKWNRVGMALFSINENNYNIFDEWSKKNKKKYNSSNNKKIWDGYKSSNFNKNMLNIGSLIYWAKEGGYKFPDKNIDNIVNSYPEKKITITKNDKLDVSTICKNKLDVNLFKKIINKKMIALQSEKGTGKTSNLIKALFESDEDPPDSILFISSRRTFGIKLSADLKKYNFRLYSEINEHYIYDKRVIVQIDSLLRLERDKFDLIIIDECESLARYMTSSHFVKNNKASTIVANLEYRIADANNIIIMDADLSDRCINFYTSIIDSNNKLTRNDIKVIINKYTPFQDYTIKYMNYNIWLNLLKKNLFDNKKMVIPMASNSKAKDLYTKLSKDFPDKKILLLHKETSDEDKLSKLLKVNEIWVNYDVVIYTPTVCMGVSFDEEHFDNIFAYGCHNSLGAQEFCQMLHRVRNIKENTIYVSFDRYKFFDNYEDNISYDQAEKMLCNDYYLTYNDLHNNLIPTKYKTVENERVIFYPYKNEPIYDLYVRNSIEQISNKLNFTAEFFGYIKFKNYKYSFFESDDNDNIEAELKQIRKERVEKEKEEEVENILKAKLLTSEEYKEKCMRKNQFLKDEDFTEIKKYNFVKTYNLDEKNITEELIEKYNDKIMMMTYNNLSSIINTENQTSLKKLEILKNNHSIGEEFRNCYQDFTYKNKYVYHMYALKLLEYCGFNINDIDIKENALLKEIIEENINAKINGKTLKKYIDDEKFGLYNKFDCRNIINREIKNTLTDLLRIVNFIINKQYGLKIKLLTNGKDTKSYYLTTNNTWNSLPNKIKPKDINEIKLSNKDYSHIINDLDNGLFIDDSSDEE